MSLVRTLLIGAAGALAVAGAAHADMSGLVGNTITINGPPGGPIKIQLKADGTYQTVSSAGVAKGTWKADGDKLCYTQTDPAPPAARPNPFCAQGMDGKKVGDNWTVPAGPNGGPAIQGAVVAGQ